MEVAARLTLRADKEANHGGEPSDANPRDELARLEAPSSGVLDENAADEEALEIPHVLVMAVAEKAHWTRTDGRAWGQPGLQHLCARRVGVGPATHAERVALLIEP